MDDDLFRMRRRYSAARLLEDDLAPDPFEQFRSWLHDAVTARLPEPNAMVLATADAEGWPSARTVLLKSAGLLKGTGPLDGVEEEGFVFFTNLLSRKAADIAGNDRVSLCFPWIAMERQVLVSGTAARVPRAVDQAYWATRPRESQVGAWASRQSRVISGRTELEAAAAEIAERFPGDVPLPEFWGGYVVRPAWIEFWQGGPGRLHDRLRYRKADGRWLIERLAP